MPSPWRRRLTEAGRFLAVGGLATAVAFVLFNLMVHGAGARAGLADRPALAYVLANSVGMAISYHGSRRWAFRDRPTRHADGGLTAFVAINLLTMLLPIGCLGISRDVLGLDDPVSDNVAANVIGLALAMCARFWLFRTFVFRRPADPAGSYPELPGPGLTGAPTARSMSDPAAPAGRGAAAG